MNSIISKLRLTYKSVLYFLVIGIIPIIVVSILIAWYSNNQPLARILIIAGIVVFFMLLLFNLLLNQKLLEPIKKVTTNLTNLHSENQTFPEEIDPASFSGEINDLLNAYNTLLSERKTSIRKEQLLIEKCERLESATQGSQIGVLDWNLLNNECYYSATWRNILGHTQESIHNLSTEWFTRVHPEDIDQLQKAISYFIDNKTPIFCNEHRLRHFNDNYIWVVTRGEVMRNDDGVAERFIGTMTNITTKKLMENRLSSLAMYDTLTGLPNKIYFSGIIDQSLGRIRRRDNYHSAILTIDLDRFKSINDKYGYEVGNEFLLEITRRLKYSLRTMDTIARFTEDKFGVLLEEINGLPDALKITQRLYDEIEKPFAYEDQMIEIGTSIGVLLLTRGYQNSNEVLRDAESAVYQAKANGRGKIELFDKESYDYQLSKIRIEKEIKQALENDEFTITYQSIRSPQENEVLLAESQLVWENPERGIIPNQYYQHALEESDQIIAINKLLLRKACQDAWEWSIEDYPKVHVAVNISSKLLLKPDFSEIILCILADTNLPNSSLQLVISESDLLYNSGVAIQNMYDLYSIGVNFCLANYGVTPSALEQMKRLPIRSIMISESILRDLPHNQDDLSITKAIIAIGKMLGIQTIATGIDTQEKADLLINEGIELIGGNYYSNNLEKNDFISYLKGIKK